MMPIPSGDEIREAYHNAYAALDDHHPAAEYFHPWDTIAIPVAELEALTFATADWMKLTGECSDCTHPYHHHPGSGQCEQCPCVIFTWHGVTA